MCWLKGQKNTRAASHYLRLRWLFSVLYISGMRISEVAENGMAGFFCRRGTDGQERWWLEITGKGDKTRIVPATQELMLELSRYRREKGLPPFPVPGEPTPLLLPIGQQRRFLTRSAVHLMVKSVLKAAAERIRAKGFWSGRPNKSSERQRTGYGTPRVHTWPTAK